ncbi:MAG TPA: LysR family transcriptional regulator [Firmicutes bacterium]|nr:LysR family transcriptional regulator [Bacillota bacterium]
MLDFRMETFLTVCQTMHFTRAAELLHITQPAVSQHIRALEQEYGAALFLHEGKKLRLTEAGRLLWSAALTMRQDARLVKEQIGRLTGGQENLTFGATLTVGEFAMPRPLAAYLRRHPESRIQMQVADTKELLGKIDRGEIDFAIVEGFFPQSEYDSLVYSTEKFIPVCGRDYAFRRRVCRVEDLLEERLLVREEGSGTRHILETYLEGRNLRIADFSRRAEIGSIAAIKSLAAAGCGVTFLYEAAVRRELAEGSLQKIPLDDFAVHHDFSFIWRKNSLFAHRYKEIFSWLQGQDTEV